MTLYLYTAERLEASLSHGAVICTQEMADDYYLMHYRTKGSRNGIRRFQDENGRLTDEGYRHYAEMYGWNKKLNKARRLQDKADKAFTKADDVAKKLDRATIDANYARGKADVAQAKNERRTTDRRQRKAEKADAKATKVEGQRDKLKTDLNVSLAKARLVQDKAVDFNNKLALKDQKMSKYVDENGNLNEKALEKYTYTTGVPGERKMSLVGRLKFGNEYTKKFNNSQVQKSTDELRKQLSDADKETIDKLSKDLNDPSKDSRKVLEKAWADMERKKFADGKGDLEPDEEHFMRQRQMQKLDDVHNEIYSTDIDKMSADRKRKLGDRVLDTLERSASYGIGEKGTDANNFNSVQGWLIDQVYEKSGSINASDYKPGTKAYEANKKVDATWQKMSDREDQVKKDIGYSGDRYSGKKYQAEQKRLQAVLQKDSVWKDLDRQFTNQTNDVMGAILQDLGFTDNPRNRSILYSYGWFD